MSDFARLQGGGAIHFSCILSMMPHFVFGAVVLRKFGFRLWENRKIGIPCLVAYIAFVLLEGDVNVNGMSFYTADSTISVLGAFRSCVCFFLRPIVGIVGSIGVMSLIKIIFDIAPWVGSVAKIGTLTLGIYIFHLWPLEHLRGIAWVGSSRWSVMATSFAMLSIFSLVTWLLVEKTGRFRKCIWGK